MSRSRGSFLVPRSVEEWVGKTPNTDIPDRVHIRVRDLAGSVCAICTRVLPPTEDGESDHIKAIVNGGANRESNLQFLCKPCHRLKTTDDVGEKRVIYERRLRHMGRRKPKGRPMPGTKASGIRRRFDGTVERR
jgi:5-methylcytosine-specific restriction enzyme A